MARVILTGASGFIGQHLLRELAERGHDVCALGRSRVSEAGAGWRRCDLLDPGTAAPLVRALGADHLVHLAWNATPGLFWSAPDNLDWVAATVHLFRAFAQGGGRSAVFAGTCAEYDWSAPVLAEDETPLRPRTLYGHAKRATGELMLAAGAAQGIAVGWARLFNVYGPGEPGGRLVSDVIDALLAGRAVNCTDGRQERDFIHVKDAARALAEILDKGFCGAVNVASGHCAPVAVLIQEIGRQTGRPELIKIGAIPRQDNEPLRLAASMHRLRHAIGFAPRFNLPDGIADTLAADRSRASLAWP